MEVHELLEIPYTFTRIPSQKERPICKLVQIWKIKNGARFLILTEFLF